MLVKGQINFLFVVGGMSIYYDEIQHLGCCGYGILNPRSSGNKLGFLALRDGIWYFVKLTIGES